MILFECFTTLYDFTILVRYYYILVQKKAEYNSAFLIYRLDIKYQLNNI